MRFTARGADGETLESRVYYSVGGGAIVDEATVARNAPPGGGWDVPYNFHSGEELLAIAARERLTIAEVARAPERGAMDDAEKNTPLAAIPAALAGCHPPGTASDGLPPRTPTGQRGDPPPPPTP